MPTPHLICYRFLQCCFVLCLATASSAQSFIPRFKQLTLEEGLPGSMVNSLLQDKRGFLWVGTSDGLARYDGYNFTVYRHDPDDRNSLSDNTILQLYEDRSGKLWIGTLSGGVNCFYPDTEEFQRFQNDPDDSLSLSHDFIKYITEDYLGYIWIGTYAGGLNRLDRQTGCIKRYQYNPNDTLGLKSNYITIIFEDSTRQLWVGTYRFGLARFNREDESFHYVFPKDKVEDETWGKYFIYSVHIDRKHKFWMAADTGIYHFDPRTNDYELYFLPYLENPDIHPNSHRSLTEDHTGQLWIASYGAISKFDPVSKTAISYFSNQEGTWGLPNANYYLCSMIDREGNLWIGSDKGLIRHDGLSDRFQNYPAGASNLLGLDRISNNYLMEDREGTLWIGSEKGLHRIEPLTKKHILFQHRNDDPTTIYRNAVYYMLENDDGTFWISIVNYGLDKLYKSTGKFHFLGTKDHNTLRYIRSIHRDRYNDIWLATWGGVMLFDPEKESFNSVPWYSTDSKARRWTDASLVFEDSEGTIWVATNFGELKSYDRNNCVFYEHLPGPKIIRYGKASISCVYEDAQGVFWIGTGEGLKRFNRKTGKLSLYTVKKGLVNNNVTGILPDNRGNLWIGTLGGLSKFNPENEVFYNFSLVDGLPSVEFTEGHCKSKTTGILYFGTTKGLIAFHPDSIKNDRFVPPVYITGFSSINAETGTGELKETKGIIEKKEIKVAYSDNILTFQFTALSYRKTAKNQYAYKLEGFNDEWIQLGSKREVTFTNLDPGTYTLRVKGSNGDGVWNEEGASLKITITPPWWRTWWAYILYALTGVGLLIAFWQYDLRRKLARAEAQRLKELDIFKTRLYTNITHEFRTPLTIISGMADQILEQPQRWLNEGIGAIKRNSHQLLRLVNQMLDLQKLEAGKMPVNMVQGDVLIYLKYLVESFESQARTKEIDLHFETNLPELVMDYDPEKLQQIVSNLLFNALKFTPAGGEVTMRADVRNPGDFGHLVLTFSDTGIGIDLEKQPYIFDRFFQADDSHTRRGEGAGIGLALTKELVKLLEGEISVQSEPGRGSVFEVKLPVRKEPGRGDFKQEITKIQAQQGHTEAKTQPQPPALLKSKKSAPENTSQPLLLIIEDNPDVVRYLTACLENSYQLATAQNGLEGIEKALETIPDLVISDVMMPEKDGFEVCETLKNDERTSHIPIILLTAKADMESKLEGLTSGADAYLPKPFDKNELLIRIQNLLELRQKLQQHYLSVAAGAADEPEEAPQKLENVFVQKVRNIVKEHLGDSHFSIDDLSREVAMSRSQLHRKMTALTGVSPNRFIRFLRLQEASQLLLKTDDNIAAIAYDTGFNDPAYFTRVFTQEFGMTPSEYREKKESRT